MYRFILGLIIILYSAICYAQNNPQTIPPDLHVQGAISVAFSPDGSKVLTSSGNIVKIWDANTSLVLGTIQEHSGDVIDMEFSPDGSQFVSTGDDSIVILWDTNSLGLIRTFEGHSDGIIDVAFSPDGNMLMTGSDDQTTKFWNVNTGENIDTIQHDGSVSSVAFSPDGSQFLVGVSNGIAELWSMQTKSLIQTFAHDVLIPEAFLPVAFSPDGSFIITGAADGNLKMWNPETGQEMRILKSENLGMVLLDVGVSSDGSYAFSSGFTSGALEFNVWDLTTGEKINGLYLRFVLQSDRQLIFAEFSPVDDTLLLSGSVPRIWDFNGGGFIRTFGGHSNSVQSVDISPDQLQIITGSADNTVKIWDMATGAQLETLTDHNANVNAVQYTNDGQQFITAGDDAKAILWDAESRNVIGQFIGHEGPIKSIALSPSNDTLVTAADDKTARVWDIETGDEILQITRDQFSSFGFDEVAFSPSGNTILTSDTSNGRFINLTLWDAETGESIRTFDGVNSLVTCLQFSPNGERFVTGSTDGLATMWDVNSGQIIRTFDVFENLFAVTSVEFYADGSLILLSASRSTFTGIFGDAITKIVDVDSGLIVKTVNEPSVLFGTDVTSTVTDSIFTPDGQTVLTAGSFFFDQGILTSLLSLWDVSDVVPQLPETTPIPISTPTPEPLTPPTLDPSDYVFWEENGHYYAIVDEIVAWQEASEIAQMYAGGTGHLATITSQEENDFLIESFSGEELAGKWLGGFQEASNEITEEDFRTGWRWITGEQWEFSNWCLSPPEFPPSEPNNLTGNEDHLQFHPASFFCSGAWNDVNNEELAAVSGFIVETEIDPLLQPTRTPTTTPTPTRTPTRTPTATPTPLLNPTSTPVPSIPTPMPPSADKLAEPLTTYQFDQPTLDDNGWQEIPGGFSGVEAGRVSIQTIDNAQIGSTEDNSGLEITVQPNQVTFIHAAQPVDTGGAPVIIRITARADNDAADLALVALKGNLTSSDNVDGSIATLIPANLQSMLEQEDAMYIVYRPDSGTEFTPAIQLASTNDTESATVWIDRMDILSLNSSVLDDPLGTIDGLEVVDSVEFDQDNLAANNWSEIPGGFSGAAAGEVSIQTITEDQIPTSADQIGLELTAAPGQVAFVHANEPVNSAGMPMLVRITARANHSAAALALVALKGNLRSGENVDGSIATLIPANNQSMLNQPDTMLILYKPDTGNFFTPAMQLASNSDNETTSVWIDKMEFYRLDEEVLSTLINTPDASPQPTPTFTPTPFPTNTPSPFPTNTPSPFPTNTPTPTTVVELSPLNEALDNNELEFTTGGDAEWFIQEEESFADGDAAQAGDIDNDQAVWLETEVKGPVTVSFYWKVSSESSFDEVEFFINGVSQGEISGNRDWRKKEVFLEGIETYTLRWVYSKDISISNRRDTAWVDQLVLTRPEVLVQLQRILEGHDDAIKSVGFSPDGTRVVTSSNDETAKIWNAATGEVIHTLEGHSNWVNSARFSPDGTQVITASGDDTAKLWEASTGELIRTFEHSEALAHAEFSPNGKTIVTGSDDDIARIWNASTGELIRAFEGHTNFIQSVAFSPDSTKVLTGSRDNDVILWDVESGEELRRFEEHRGDVRSVAFSSDGALILTSGVDDTARIWNTETGDLVLSFEEHDSDVWSAVFSPDDTMVLTGSADNTAMLWDAKTGEVISTLSEHDDDVFSVAFSPDGTQILTGGLEDKVAILWDIVDLSDGEQPSLPSTTPTGIPVTNTPTPTPTSIPTNTNTPIPTIDVPTNTPTPTAIMGEITLAEALDNDELTFTTGGNGAWIGQTEESKEDGDAAQAIPGEDLGSPWLETTVEGPGEISFYWKVSPGSSNFIHFLIDENSPTFESTFQSPNVWEKKSFFIEPGTHTLKWEFDGDGRGWVDQVEFNTDNLAIPAGLQLVQCNESSLSTDLFVENPFITEEWVIVHVLDEQGNIINPGTEDGLAASSLDISLNLGGSAVGSHRFPNPDPDGIMIVINDPVAETVDITAEGTFSVNGETVEFESNTVTHEFLPSGVVEFSAQFWNGEEFVPAGYDLHFEITVYEAGTQNPVEFHRTGPSDDDTYSILLPVGTFDIKFSPVGFNSDDEEISKEVEFLLEADCFQTVEVNQGETVDLAVQFGERQGPSGGVHGRISRVDPSVYLTLRDTFRVYLYRENTNINNCLRELYTVESVMGVDEQTGEEIVEFTFEHIPPGDYILSADSFDSFGGHGYISDEILLSIPAGENRRQDLSVTSQGFINPIAPIEFAREPAPVVFEWEERETSDPVNWRYEIFVLDQCNNLVWSRDGIQQNQVTYQGPPLVKEEIYFWYVKGESTDGLRKVFTHIPNEYRSGPEPKFLVE